MPTATDDLRALMLEWFDDPISDYHPTQFLLSRGWKEVGGAWSPPVSHYTISFYEWHCLKFLIQEWDHGVVEDAIQGGVELFPISAKMRNYMIEQARL